jgi:mRNA-degrading endonuclease HigB of HigAB toxin-antitoxin module
VGKPLGSQKNVAAADVAGKWTVFNITGNKYLLIGRSITGFGGFIYATC